MYRGNGNQWRTKYPYFARRGTQSYEQNATSRLDKRMKNWYKQTEDTISVNRDQDPV